MTQLKENSQGTGSSCVVLLFSSFLRSTLLYSSSPTSTRYMSTLNVSRFVFGCSAAVALLPLNRIQIPSSTSMHLLRRPSLYNYPRMLQSQISHSAHQHNKRGDGYATAARTQRCVTRLCLVFGQHQRRSTSQHPVPPPPVGCNKEVLFVLSLKKTRQLEAQDRGPRRLGASAGIYCRIARSLSYPSEACG